jgi:DNA repair protein RadC
MLSYWYSRNERIIMKKLMLSNNYLKVMEACSAYIETEKPECNNPLLIYSILRPIIKASTNDQQEAFYIILLDNKSHMMGSPIEVFKGVASACYASPREIFQKALMNNAVSIVVAHNHPSGDPEPSKADIEVTRKLVAAGEIIGVPIVDHVICGIKTSSNDGFISMRQSTYSIFP